MVIIMQCPITVGRPTKMTEEGFAAMCKSRRTLYEAGFCRICQGEQRPAELEIIQAAELAAMTQQREASMGKEKGSCELCGASDRRLGGNRGKQACPSCQSLIGSVAIRPEAVAEAIKLCGAEQVIAGLLGDARVQVSVESRALKRIAAAVGYEGEDGEVLIKAVEAMAATRAGDDSPTPCCSWSPDMLRALGCDDQGTELAAIQTAAMLEDAERRLTDLALVTHAFGQEKERAMGLETYIASALNAAGIARDIPLDEWIQALREDNVSMGERLREIRIELGVGMVGDVVAAVHGAVQQARHGRELAGRLAQVEAENVRLNGLLDQQNNSLSLYVDPTREDLIAFALRVIRGEVVVAHCTGMA